MDRGEIRKSKKYKGLKRGGHNRTMMQEKRKYKLGGCPNKPKKVDMKMPKVEMEYPKPKMKKK